MRANPSILRKLTKNKSIKTIYDIGFEFFFSQFAHSLPKKIRREMRLGKLGKKRSLEMIGVRFPKETSIMFRYAPLPGIDAIVQPHKGSSKVPDFIEMSIHPLPVPDSLSTARKMMNGLRALYDHEFVHLLQLMQPFASGRRRKEGDYPNQRMEHKPHLEQLVSLLKTIVWQIDSVPLDEVSKDAFPDFIATLNKQLHRFGCDNQMRKMILKDIYKTIAGFRGSPELRAKLKAGGFPI